MNKAVKSGYAISMKFQDITRDSLRHSLNELLYDPSYKAQVEKVSEIFKDRPLPAMETAMYWVDYIIRHKAANHNRSGGLDLKWYEFYLLDVIVLAALSLGIVLCVVLYVLKLVLNVVGRKNKIKIN